MKSLFFASFLLFLLAGSPAPAATVTLSPEGPIRSLAEARDELRKQRKPGEPLQIIVADGEYSITEPLVLEPQDSGSAENPLTIEAAPGAHPVITGGRRITGWTVQPDGLWQTEIPEVREGKWYFEQLWVNGARATRARTPNDEWFQAAGAATEPVPGAKSAGPLDRTAIVMRPEDLGTLQNLSPEEMHDVNTIVYHSWNVSRHRLAGIDPASGTIQFTGPARWGFFQNEPYHRVVFENYRAALDAPGEWFLDRKGVLLYMPHAGEDPAKAEVIAPVTPRWLELRGDAEKHELVSHVRFQGLTFAHSLFLLSETGWNDSQADATLEAAIQADGSSDITFDHCDFEHTGAYTMWFRHGCSDSRLTHCHLHEMGAGGVKIGETTVPKTEDGQTHGITIENCIIQEGGRYFTGSIGVWVGHSGENAILHCDIGDFYYTAISLGWVWGFKPSLAHGNRVEWNHLHHLGWGVLSDMGAVYTLGPSPGTVVSHNLAHDIACYSYGGWGLYTDEGSTGILLEDNLVYRTESGGFHQHYGQDNIVRNNIFAYAREWQIRHSRSEDHLAFTFEQNIVLWKEGQLLGHTNAGWQGPQVKLDRNLYWPGNDQPFEFAGKTLEEWRASGQDVHSIIADPMFVDPEHDNFHLKPGSPVEKIGFKPFDYEKAGVEGEPEWKALAAARKYAPMSFAALTLEPTPLSFHEGFEFAKMADRMGPFRMQTGGKEGAIQIVTDQPAKGAKCLQLTDGPEARPAFNPHFYCSPKHHQGTTTFSFDVRAEPDYDLQQEWRDNATPYHAGPQVRIGHGKLTVAGKPLADVSPGEWLHLQMEAGIGDSADGTWTLTLTRPGQDPQRFEKLPYVHPAWKTLEWLGFSSGGTKPARCWLDELELKHRP